MCVRQDNVSAALVHYVSLCLHVSWSSCHESDYGNDDDHDHFRYHLESYHYYSIGLVSSHQSFT